MTIDLNGDRSIDTELNTSLIFGSTVATAGTGGFTKSGLGRFEIQGTSHAFGSFSVRDGVAAVTARGADYVLGGPAENGEPCRWEPEPFPSLERIAGWNFHRIPGVTCMSGEESAWTAAAFLS